MKARPILMSAPMVRALLDGKKTQTRRTINPQPEFGFVVGARVSPRCPYGRAGDLLWCRETFAEVGNVDPPWVLYRANGYNNECKRHRFDNPPPESQQKWRPAIFMPRQHSRITLRITEVRVERLQDISYEDACAEGCEIPALPIQDNAEKSEQCSRRLQWPQRAYSQLWDSINGAGSWAANQWVWAISFAVVQKNVAEVLANVQ